MLRGKGGKLKVGQGKRIGGNQGPPLIQKEGGNEGKLLEEKREKGTDRQQGYKEKEERKFVKCEPQVWREKFNFCRKSPKGGGQGGG